MTTPDPAANAPQGNPADGLTDAHADALLADAVARANAQNAAAGTQNPGAGTPNAGTPNPAGNGTDDPAALRAEIERLRRENAASRVNAKAAAADEAKQQFAQQIGKILGLVPDETPVDPVKLTEQLTAAQQASRNAALELAVYKAAGQAGANPVALVDSRTFLASVADTDPADMSAITAAITQAVTQNPALAAAAPPASGMKPNPSQGRSATPPASNADQAQAALASGNIRELMRANARMVLSNEQ